ncbi:hypothetical protein [Rhodococcus baikonurensis]|uniref:Uncharacterized protein n=1 Tax=Rhodococcus baikonurensis TaxID=172041 RepID=A0ABV5XPE3_9NOCA
MAKLVGKEDNDPYVDVSTLPDWFKKALGGTKTISPSPYSSYFWPSTFSGYEQMDSVDISRLAHTLKPEEWSNEADFLFRVLAEKFRGYTPWVFGDRVNGIFPELDEIGKNLLGNQLKLESFACKAPYASAVAYGRARTKIRWNLFPDKDCPLCGLPVYPNHHFGKYVSETGYSPRWCESCSSGASQWEPTPDEAIEVLQYFVEVAGFIPKTYREISRIPADLPGEQRDRIAAARLGIPWPGLLVKLGLNPWQNYLAKAGLGEGFVTASRGIQSEADDGHWCLSIFERQIDDFMSSHQIVHSREPKWPKHETYNANGAARADWLLADGAMVEAAGMMSVKSYAAKMNIKRALAESAGIKLVIVTPSDLGNLEAIFLPWIPRDARILR